MYDLPRGTPSRSATVGAPTAPDPELARATEALRRAGGALPAKRLGAALGADAAGHPEPLTRRLRRHAELFLLVERPTVPPEAADTWTDGDRAEYDRAVPRDETVVLLDALTGATSVRAPAVLRESLLSMWGESPDDDVRRELARLADLEQVATPAR